MQLIQHHKKDRQTTLSDLGGGVLQLAAHDLYNVNRITEVDSEDEILNLFTFCAQAMFIKLFTNLGRAKNAGSTFLLLFNTTYAVENVHGLQR